MFLIYRPDSDRYYNFTELACQLNEPEPGVAPSDTRNRPDQRLMENGLWDEANIEKVRLEEKQRAARKVREAEAEKAAAEGIEIQKKLCSWSYCCYEFVIVYSLNICFHVLQEILQMLIVFVSAIFYLLTAEWYSVTTSYTIEIYMGYILIFVKESKN